MMMTMRTIYLSDGELVYILYSEGGRANKWLVNASKESGFRTYSYFVLYFNFTKPT